MSSYPPEPWYLGGSLLVSAFLVPLTELPAGSIPKGRRPIRWRGRVIVGAAFAQYVPGGVLDYNELLVAVPSLGGPRVTIPQIWVDSAASMAGGRALWGIPKQLAEFERSDSPAGATVSMGSVASLDATYGARLAGMHQVPLTTMQSLDGRRTVAHNRVIARGYRVVIGDLDLAATDATALELGEGVSAVRLDVTDPAAVAAVIDQVETEVGPIDLWINNAGIMPTEPFATQKPEVAQRIITINYASVVSATGLILPRMLTRNNGTIVNMASATGIKPLAGVAVYSGTKAAVIAFSDALRREIRKTGVNVIVVNPNLVRTAMGAGITPPALTGSVSAQTVSTAVMRALDKKRFWVVVPRRLGPILRFSKALPTSWQDWIDDRAGSDQIGLGGDPAARAAYAKDALDK